MEGEYPLSHQRGVQAQGAIQQLTQGLGAFVTNAGLGCPQASGDREVHPRLHEDQELIFGREALPSTPHSAGEPQRPSSKKWARTESKAPRAPRTLAEKAASPRWMRGRYTSCSASRNRPA